MASFSFTNLAYHLALGEINFDTDVFYCMLVTSVPTTIETTGDQDTWIYRSHVTNEVAAGDYTIGGFLVTPIGAPVLDLTTNTCNITFKDAAPAFASATITARGGIIFRRVGIDLTTPADDEVIGFVDFLGDITSTNGDFNVTFTDPLAITV